MDLRTIQRWLVKLVERGLVENKYNKYSLSEPGKRHLQFREFVRSYGLIALNNVMNFYFPTLYTVDQNLKKLVEIFGTYVVYCLIEAARLIISNKTNNEEHWRSSYFWTASNFIGILHNVIEVTI
jgi:predicted transcriptional regulator